jgi:phosphate transport system substrate-binding protein
MTKTDGNWKNEIGTGKQLNFPVGIAAKGNPGVAGIISQTEGSIGYIGSEYALALGLSSALLQNSSGNFVEANAKSISAAAEIEIPDDTRLVITGSPNPEAYPISTFTWIIAYKEQHYNNRTQAQAKALVDLFEFIIGKQGQEIATVTYYAPLSAATLAKTKALIESVTFDGNPLGRE